MHNYRDGLGVLGTQTVVKVVSLTQTQEVEQVRTSIAAAILLVAIVPTIVHAAEWHERMKIKGDFRHRHEMIREEGKVDQNRWRIRARLAAEVDVSESWSAAIALASGSDDPISTNQTLTDGFSTKPFGLDLAYFDFHPSSIKNLHVIAGKMKQPFETVDKTELLWDGDLNPEGLAIKFSGKLSEAVKIYLNGAGLYIKDRDPDDESYMGGVQGGFDVKAAKKIKIMVGVGYYDYEGAKGKPFFYSTSKSFGNSKATGDVYAVDFNEAEAMGMLDVSLSEKAAIKLYGNYVQNTAADSLSAGWLFGAAVNKGKDKGSLKVYANYRKLEADAVVGAFTDSDFIGSGTNGKGLELGAAYGVAKNVNFDLTYFVNKKGLKSTDTEKDYKRLQVDMQLKF